MLVINIHNDSTGTDEIGNYNYTVKINYEIISSGRIEGHERLHGWEALVIEMAKQIAKGLIEKHKE